MGRRARGVCSVSRALRSEAGCSPTRHTSKDVLVTSDAHGVIAAYLQELTRDGGAAPYSNLQKFVEPRVQAPECGIIPGSLERLQAESRLLLQGNPATGKTTAIKVVVNQLARAYMESNSARCPVLVAASILRLPGDDPWTWLATAAAQQVEGDQQIVDALASILKDGRAHIFVDGLDEIPESHLRFRVVETLSSIIDMRTDLKMCVSTRP